MVWKRWSLLNIAIFGIHVTPWKTNMSPENHWLEDVFPIEIVLFRGHVSFRGCSFQKTPQKNIMELT